MKTKTIVTVALLSLVAISATGEAFSQRQGVSPVGAADTPSNYETPQKPDPEVCFYTGKLYTGANFCTRERGYFLLSPYWTKRIRSMTIKHSSVKACNTADMKGTCHNYSADVDLLAEELINGVKAVHIR